MIFPIVIITPYQGDEHRNALQRRVIDAIEKDSGYGMGAFWGNFWFYPYCNRSPTTLTPTALYDLLDQELDLFLPEEAASLDLKAWDDPNTHFQRHLRQPIVPSYYNQHEECEAQQQKWDLDRMAVVVDDEELQTVKLFLVDEGDLYRRACRRRMEAGEPLSKEEIEFATLDDSDEEDLNDDGQEDVSPKLEHKYAAWFLGRKTAKWCRLRGIYATRIKTNKVSSAVVNLSQANMDFEEFVE